MTVKGYHIVKCGTCTADIVLTAGDYKHRMGKSKTGNLFCSQTCASHYISENHWTKRVVRAALKGEGPESKD